ncbi:MAG: M23 family metallopeptidase [bacterium]|nr:M23 family metallopeptidase [bacterium]
MNESKFLNNKNGKRKKNFFSKLLSKILVCIIIVLIALIVFKAKPEFKDYIKDKVFTNNISFAKINKWYKEKFGGILPVDEIISNNEVSVFSEELKYENDSLYKDGCSLEVEDNYLVPVLQSGIVVFIGQKDNYDKTVIIQQVNGIDVWYGNIDSEKIKLYDYVEKGTLLGNVKNNKLYLVFQKDGKYLDYKEYI